MYLIAKRLETTKTQQEVLEIIKSFAYFLPKAQFNNVNFVIYCAKRHKGGILSLIPIKGTVVQREERTEICLSLCAGLGFYLGVFLVVLGALVLLWCLFSHSTRWIPGVGAIILGIIVGGQFLGEGNELLDKIEQKLLN